MVDRGHASPRLTPSICVREAGQMGASPSMSTCQSVGMGTTGTEEAWVVGWEIR
jgi:hypothetical protein